MSWSETRFCKNLKERLQDKLGDRNVQVEDKKNVIYDLHINDDGKPTPADEAKRGENAFQSDVVISEKEPEVPRIVIEVKRGSTTHDPMVYSNKARLIKQVYPFLRYILLDTGEKDITYKLIRHGEYFDAIIPVSLDSSLNITETDLNALAKILSKEIGYSRALGEIVRGKQAEMYWRQARFRK